MTKYWRTRDKSYDFVKEGYSEEFPLIHKYPATMLPQIGAKLLKEFGCDKAKRILDPYCGSGSTFASAMLCGKRECYGYDLNPLAILISKVRFTNIDIKKVYDAYRELIARIRNHKIDVDAPEITNIDIWYSKDVVHSLGLLRSSILQIHNNDIRDFFFIVLSEAARKCSRTKNGEFKLCVDKKKRGQDAFAEFETITYRNAQILNDCYLSQAKKLPKLTLKNEAFKMVGKKKFDVVLTSPPYGDSQTTVSYGQFSSLGSEWIGIGNTRKLDKALMGGTRIEHVDLDSEVVRQPILDVFARNPVRSLDVGTFYMDLQSSIREVAKSVKPNGKVFYIVGNRTVQNVVLPTDQFVAEQFELNGFKHLKTIERSISGKAMPSRNSPTNEAGKIGNTMSMEYIVCCQKI